MTAVVSLPAYPGLRAALIRFARDPAVEFAAAATIMFAVGFASACQI